MKLIFRGHDSRYAVEQSLLAFFPQERPVYEPAAPDEDNCAWITLSQEKTWTTAVTTIRYGDKTARGISRETIAPGLDPYEAERLHGYPPRQARRAHARGGQVAARGRPCPA